MALETVKGRDNRRDKEWKMIMFDIAEWVANILVLGLGLLFWALAFGVSFLIITELKERYIDE